MERLTTWNGVKWILPQGRNSEGESYWRIIADRLAMYENADEAGWVDTRDCEPLADGNYYIQTVFGEIDTIHYTFKGGWNTRYYNGELSIEYAYHPKYVARWYRIPAPPKVPQEWQDEFYDDYRKGVRK